MPEPANPAARWTDELLDSMRLVTDPVADKVIDDIVAAEGSGAARTLFETLISNVELPIDQLPEVAQAYFREYGKLPDWADRALMKKGEDVFLDYGPSFFTFLFFKSLPTTYRCWRGAQVLYLTGRLTEEATKSKIYRRRLAETAQFIIDVMTPGFLVEGGQGIQTALKIRLIHASIRHFIPKDKWNETEWGKPICQEDMAGTLMAFSSVMIDGLQQVGITVKSDLENAYLHSWRVVGHLIGVNPKLLPDNIAEGRALVKKILERQSGTSEAGKNLTRALLDFADEMIPGKLFDNTAEVMVRFYVGNDVAELLGVPPANGCLTAILPAFIKRMLGWVNHVEEHNLPLEKVLSRVNLEVLHGMMKYVSPDKGKPFRLPDNLKERWGLIRPGGA